MAGIFETMTTIEPNDWQHRLRQSNFKLTRPVKAERLESLTVEVNLAPKQVLKGGQIRILLPARVICPACRGRGMWEHTNAGVVEGMEH